MIESSKNRTTLVAEALLKGEEEALVRKAIELATSKFRDHVLSRAGQGR
jgi:hypothetical protein